MTRNTPPQKPERMPTGLVLAALPLTVGFASTAPTPTAKAGAYVALAGLVGIFVKRAFGLLVRVAGRFPTANPAILTRKQRLESGSVGLSDGR